MEEQSIYDFPTNAGKYGNFGGKFVPETLITALEELETAYQKLKDDKKFIEELNDLQSTYNGRPTPLTFSKRLTEHYGGGKIYLKREDLCHTGAHKLNNALGQILIAKYLGKNRIIAETGAGQHGVATATVCAKFGLDCFVFMGEEDIERQKLNVFRMKMLGAKVIPVSSGSKTLKDATNEAIRDWITNVSDTHYIIGSVVGPHPYPMIVRDFQSIIGKEAKEQIISYENKLPNYVLACVGGGSNAIGIFHEFINDKEVQLIGVEAAGFGLDSNLHCATLTRGKEGIFHGMKTYLLQTEDGQVAPVHSVSAGLDYPGVGPEHSFLKDLERVKYYSVSDDDALAATVRISKLEGILPALETAHAFAYLEKLMPLTHKDEIIIVNVSGRGDKDLNTIIDKIGDEL
jgi:tryptophan synthase beta chain